MSTIAEDRANYVMAHYCAMAEINIMLKAQISAGTVTTAEDALDLVRSLLGQLEAEAWALDRKRAEDVARQVILEADDPRSYLRGENRVSKRKAN
ncbi:hypothetical protein [Paracoccus binzhouensis]|uniref:hypothetical protein n=1 Tax=Paracoccus binzhouensis TaxID=2796149 RepID=UPI0018EF35FE|nr:hypothetical protein [Paracoccus binzhouensis]